MACAWRELCEAHARDFEARALCEPDLIRRSTWLQMATDWREAGKVPPANDHLPSPSDS